MFTIIRNNIYCRVGVSDISTTDLVLCADGRFKLAVEIPSLYAFLSHAKWVRERVVEAQERNGWLAVLLFVGLALFLFLEFCDPPPKAGFRWRPRNDEPLPAGTRALVRERDGEICAYCRHFPDGHVDHRVSRVNGGSNRLHNLSWACPPSTLKKGPMNARQFIRLSTRSAQI